MVPAGTEQESPGLHVTRSSPKTSVMDPSSTNTRAPNSWACAPRCTLGSYRPRGFRTLHGGDRRPQVGSNAAAVVLRSALRFGRFFRSPLPQHHVALSGEHHADTCAALADPNLSSLVGPVLGKPGCEFWVVRSAPLE